MAKGFGIPKRRAILEGVGERDPARYDELVALRRSNPQAYRKAIKRIARTLDEPPTLPEPEPPPRPEVVTRAAPAPDLRTATERATSASRAEQAAFTGTDFSVLDLSIKALRATLRTGAHDGDLPALIEAEGAGRGRRGALTALRKRLDLITSTNG